MRHTTVTGAVYTVTPTDEGYAVRVERRDGSLVMGHAVEVAGGKEGMPLVIIWARQGGRNGATDTIRVSQTVTSNVIRREET